ncbi:outer membrane lipoprotein [Ralstonia solanacearum]|uniref:glycine zipper 2TM domain-containing protein n=1 Tax=Ralstonia solanacearum TaxID=305 RepID=UPI0007D82A9A|nr:glycine zipper 2TM domain-containing protein [Ralstonia solanacearum]OAI62889.1 outer membrane lipoprotein [Ralstonia solanacearum]
MMNNMQPNTQGQQYAGASPGQVPQSRRMHPLIATAAVAVIIASLTAVAAITGVLPTSKATQGNTDPNVAAQSSTATATGASAPMALAAPAGQTAPNQQQAAPYPAQQNVAPTQPPVHRRQPVYSERAPSPATEPSYAQTQPRASASPYAGRVTSITPITTQGNETGLGVIGGAVVGGLLGNQVGGGNGRTLATVAGAVGGGYAGHVAENHYNRDTQYRVNVRMDNGSTRSFTYKAAPGFQVGDRVHVEDGSLVAG